jgi:alpha-D-ribose 1-methylphosphonate 5-triphosphate synthase subunit PhnH
VTPAFADPPVESARAFRAAMEAMARPGTIRAVTGAPAPEGLSEAAAILLLTLTDATTPVHLAGPAAGARGWLTFHTGAPAEGPGACAFACGPWGALGPLETYPQGTPDYPDRSATLIAEVDRLAAEGARLTGPGIEAEARLPLPDEAALRRNAARYPLGVDLFLTCGDRLAGLPRSTRIG